MTRITALLALLILLGGAFLLRGCFGGPDRGQDDGASLEIKYRYLVVSIEAPADWVKGHRFSTQWQGKTVSLPVVFRVPGPAENVALGAGPEFMKCLVIGDQEVLVSASPETKFRVGNEPGFAFHPEKSPRAGVSAFSLVSWVVVCPLERPGQVSPHADKDEIRRAGNKVEERLRKLLSEDRVIDIPPDQLTRARQGGAADRP